MADTPWTKGPWRVSADTSAVLEVVAGEQDEDGAEWYICRPYSGFADGVQHANARLISAAPDMAEALTLLVDEYCDYMRLNNLGDCEKQHNIKLARAALAKASGEQ